MSHIIVEQSAREIAQILDDLDRIRDGLEGIDPQKWVDAEHQPRVLWESLRTLHDRVQYAYILIGDWETLMSKSEGIPDAPPESL